MSTVARMRSNSNNNPTKAKKAGGRVNNNKPTGVELRRSARRNNNKVDRSSDLDVTRTNSKKTRTTTSGSTVRQRVAALESNGKAAVTPPQPQKPTTTAGEANFITSSPKRKPRESVISGTREGLIRKRRRAEVADSNHSPTTPLFKRKHHNLRNMSTADDEEEEDMASPSTYRCAKRKQSNEDAEMEEREEQPKTPTRTGQQRQQQLAGLSTAPQNRSGEAAPSPLKSILSPVFDLLRRVSGIAQDPLGLQNKPDDTTPSADDSPLAGKGKRSLRSTESELSDCSMPGGFYGQLATLETGGSPPPGSAGANSLTAPPMNPTTTTLTSYLSHHRAQPSSSSNSSNNGNNLTANDMQLYLPESVEFGGPDSCSASPLTAGFPETPSKENIPIHNYSDDQTSDAATNGSTTLNELLAFTHGNDVANGDDTVNAYSRYLATLRPTVADPSKYEDYPQYEEEEEEEFNPYLFMADLPPIPKEHTLRPYALPRKTRSCKPITLVLDLDETLVHCATNQVENPDLVFPVEYNGINYNVYCRLRPGYKEFLERASQLFEVVVFTASQQVYADRLLNMIDGERKLIKHRLFRDSCVYVNTNYVKDLGILGRDESKMILVDNCPQAFAYQQSNGIPIESWYEDRRDRELNRLMKFLETLVDVEDVRPLVESRYRTKERVNEARRRFQIRMAAAASSVQGGGGGGYSPPSTTVGLN